MAVRLTKGGAAIFMPPRLGAAVNSPAQAPGKEENQMKKYAFFSHGAGISAPAAPGIL